MIPIFESIPNNEKYTLPLKYRIEILEKFAESNVNLGKEYFDLDGSPFKPLDHSDEKENEISVNDSFNLMGEILCRTI